MKILLLILIIFVCNPIQGQGKNRFALQTGLVHCFFDGSKSFDNELNKGDRKLKNLFGGVLNDSRSIQYQRLILNKYSVSVEYSKFSAGYIYKETYNNSNVTPIISGKYSKSINVTFSKRLGLDNNLAFMFGTGFNYIWGYEQLYHWTLLNGWGEPFFLTFYKKNLGLNARTGIEYTPFKWLTLYSNIDFTGIVYLNTWATDGSNPNTFYKEKYGMKNTPSRTDLSLNFGIGFNF